MGGGGRGGGGEGFLGEVEWRVGVGVVGMVGLDGWMDGGGEGGEEGGGGGGWGVRKVGWMDGRRR